MRINRESCAADPGRNEGAAVAELGSTRFARPTRANVGKQIPGNLAGLGFECSPKLPADFPSGGISNVPGILMKQSESTRGVPLAGLAVKVTNGFFLIGLSAVDADKERNLQLLKERGWFDIPIVYNNNRRAI